MPSASFDGSDVLNNTSSNQMTNGASPVDERRNSTWEDSSSTATNGRSNSWRAVENTNYLRSGWMTRLGGHVKPRWRKRFFTLDTDGRLAYYQSEADAGCPKKTLGALRLQCVLFITGRRADLSGGPWPHSVTAERCLHIVTSERTYHMFCDSLEDRERWLVALRSAAGQENSGDVIEVDGGQDDKIEQAIATRCSSAVRVRSQCPRRRSVASTVRPAESVLSLASMAPASPIDYDVVTRFNMTSLPPTVQANFCKWHAIMRRTLDRLSDAFQLCDDDGFEVECDFGALFDESSTSVRGRLGELIFGDYIGELRHSLEPLSRHALGSRLVSAQLHQRLIVIRPDDQHAPSLPVDGPGHETTVCGGILYLTVDPRRLGDRAHLTGCDFIDSLRIQIGEANETGGGEVEFCDVRACVAVDVLAHEKALNVALAELQSSVPGLGDLRFECNWEIFDQLVRNTRDAEMGRSIARRRLAKLAIADVTVPLLQRLAKICRSEKLFAKKVADKLEEGVIEFRPVDHTCGSHGCMLSWQHEGTLWLWVDVERVVRGLGEELNKVDLRSWLDYDGRVIETDL